MSYVEREAFGEPTAAAARRVVVAALFGDRRGLAVFLGSLSVFGLLWQTAFLINDSYTLANGLYALTNGDIFLTEAAYGPGLETPGANQADGGLIARNYGAIVLSIPFWLLLEGLAAVADLRIAIIGLWSLALLGFVVQVARLRNSERIIVGGSIVVLALFIGNVALARTVDPTATHLYALQLLHMTVATFAPVLLYRLFSRMETHRIGLLAASLLVFATPLSLWSSVPKRHALTVTAVVAVAYALYRSRTPADGELIASPVTFRALAYAVVGLYAWVHAPEALLFLVVLAAVDVPTAPDNSPTALAIVGVGFVLSLIPFFITNLVVTGSALRPPRLLAIQGGSSVASRGASSQGGSSGGVLTLILGALEPILSPLGTAVRPLTILFGQLREGLNVLLIQPQEFYHTLVRSGDAAGALNNSGTESVNLSVFESAPILVAIAGGLPVIWRRFRPESLFDRSCRAATAVDLFAVAAIVTTTLLYASRLPVYAQITVRYLFVLYPLGVYLVMRVPAVRDTLDTHWRTFAWTAAVTTFIGGQLLVVVVFLTVSGIGEAFQLHALVALAGAAPLGLWSLIGRSDGWFGHIGAVLLGVATALTTLFALLVVVEYYPLGDSHALPMMRSVAELLELL